MISEKFAEGRNLKKRQVQNQIRFKVNNKIAISGNPYLFDEKFGLSKEIQNIFQNGGKPNNWLEPKEDKNTYYILRSTLTSYPSISAMITNSS